jgi:uncharacterized protein (DUF1810 family)
MGLPMSGARATLRNVTDRFSLQRFVDAQDRDGIYDQAVRELRAGRKHSHWMWFVFPQIKGLGSSPMAEHYAITGLGEAEAYLAHPVLSRRLLECARALTELDLSDPERVLGPVDAQKLRSSMTLFAEVAPDEPVFAAVLDQYFDGARDPGTTSRLGGRPAG